MAKAKKTAVKAPVGATAVGKATGKVTSIRVRMYRGGTGDFFLLQFVAGTTVTFRMMIDCGCIRGSKEVFTPLIADLVKETKGKIDLLVVTHEHADHINGFQLMSKEFEKIEVAKLWFAWTEDDTDKLANEYRKKYTRMKMALAAAGMKLRALSNDTKYKQQFGREQQFAGMLAAQQDFADRIDELYALNALAATGSGTDTMVDKLKEWKVIGKDTVVEFFSPGDIIENLQGATGLRFYVLGPPRELSYLSMEQKTGQTYEKREEKSTVEFAFVTALADGPNRDAAHSPFDGAYELKKDAGSPIRASYQAKENGWRTVDNDWLNSAGALALELQQSINNTSLALAIQFEDSERVLLFPGDAEYGCWQSWHDKLRWNVRIGGKQRIVDINYLLKNTVFYKVSHHLSQNGTASHLGVDLMTHPDLAAMATLDLKRIMDLWRNTMPNDFLGAQLITRTRGRIFFTGEREPILKNIRTGRVTVGKSAVEMVDGYNKPFDRSIFIEYEVK
ncbi:MAG TPA: hypothetical protein VGQ51_06455 [Puia sp.]|jgi:hypothetical protein|nr:hypothetical protein [Puia sp.]